MNKNRVYIILQVKKQVFLKYLRMFFLYLQSSFSISVGSCILKDISFWVLLHIKDKNLAWSACLENDLMISINLSDESLAILLPGS